MKGLLWLLLLPSLVSAGWQKDCRHELHFAVQTARREALSCRLNHGTTSTTTTTTSTTSFPVTPDNYDSQNCNVPGILYQGIQYLRVEHPFGDLRQCSPYLVVAQYVGSSPCVILYNDFIYNGQTYCPSSLSGAFAAP